MGRDTNILEARISGPQRYHVCALTARRCRKQLLEHTAQAPRMERLSRSMEDINAIGAVFQRSHYRRMQAKSLPSRQTKIKIAHVNQYRSFCLMRANDLLSMSVL